MAVGSTDVVGDMQHLRSSRCFIDLDTQGMLILVDDDINVECFGECYDFHVVAISTPFSHTAQVALEGCIEFGGRGCVIIGLGCECARVLSLWISSSATARVDFNEALVIVSVGSHVLYGFLTDLYMLRLMSIKLVGKSMEKTVPWSKSTR